MGGIAGTAFTQRVPHRAARLARCLILSLLLSLLAALPLALSVFFASPHAEARGAGRSSCAGTAQAVPSGAVREHISIARGETAVGTLEQVVGTRWPVGTEISITVEYASGGTFVDSGNVVARATVVTDGGFSTPAFRLPPPGCNLAAPPGTRGRIVASGLDPLGAQGAMVVYVPITLVAAPSVSVNPAPRQLSAGTRALPVVGSGWGAGAVVSLALGRLSSSSATPTLVEALPDATPVEVTTGQNGAFSASVQIPASLRWGTIVQVMASANTTAYGDVALLDASFAMPLLPPRAPSIALSRVTANPGDPITVAGEHWWPGDTIRLEVCEYAPYTPANPSTQPLGTAVIGPAGTFATQVRLPQSLGVFPHVAILAFTSDYDPTNTPFFLQTAQFGVLANAPSLGPVSPVVMRPPLQFDLGTLLGVMMVVLVALILAEPVARQWKARARRST